MPKISEKQPATTKIKGKKLDFNIEKETQHTPTKIKHVPSKNSKPKEVIEQSSDRKKKSLDTYKIKDKQVMAKSSWRNKGNHSDTIQRSLC